MGETVMICVSIHNLPPSPSTADPVRLCALPPSAMSCDVRARLLHVCMRMPCPGELPAARIST